MPWPRRLYESLRRAFEAFRVRIARAEALAQLSVLGVLCGLAAGLVILALRFVIETAQSLLLPGGEPENFEALPAAWRFGLPVFGGLLVGLLLRWTPEAGRVVGVVHVMERLAYHQGRLPFVNALLQFAGAALCIVSGHSVGREGPAVHLGAACGSLTGQWLALPHNSLRVLAGSGAAAAIAAMFNTPLAGVSFAMEVVMMEYTVVGFAPVILAAASATALSRLVYGDAPAFAVPPLTLGSLFELPWVLAMGVGIGVLAALFIRLLRGFATRGRHLSQTVRATLAGGLVGLSALAVPQIMGIGYDTVNAALLGELGGFTLIAVVAAKLFATAAGIGLGLPAGLIGPTLVLGAAAGGFLGIAGQWLVAPAEASSAGFYALLGMGAMMAGTLHAPLAALTAMLELTGNLNIVFPGMVAVIASVITCRQLFREPPVFVMLMRVRGLDYRHDPVAQQLRRVGVAAAMETRLSVLPARATRAEIEAALATQPRWILVRHSAGRPALLSAADLAHALRENDAAEFDLFAVPGERLQAAPVDLLATLQEAFETLQASGAEALYVRRPAGAAAGGEHIHGVLTRDDIERGYRL